MYRKVSKLGCWNYRPNSFLSNIEKILGRLIYNRLYNFLESEEIIFSLELCFREKYYNTYTLIHLTDKIRYEIDKGNYACGFFAGFQKTFETVDHHILMKKHECYGVRGISNKWFASYLNKRKQFVSINGYKSNLADANVGCLKVSHWDLFCFLFTLTIYM